jgi:hypothetical protein
MAVRVDISCRREAPGHAVGLRSGTACSSCCWRSTVHRGCRAALGQSRGGVARSVQNQKREARAADSLETTCGCYPSKQSCWRSYSGGELRQHREAAAGGLGRGVARSGKASRRSEGSGRARGRRVERRWSRREPWAARHEGLQWRYRAAEEEAEEEEEGGRWGLICKFKGFRDLTVKQNSSLF